MAWLIMFNFISSIVLFLYLWKKKSLIGYQLGMNISMTIGGMSGIYGGVYLIYLYPLFFVEVTIVTTIFAISVGSIFGGMFDYQTILTGWASGLMSGIMAPMIGSAATFNDSFIVFIEIVFISVIVLLVLSIKHT
jgi:hypothetical protein